MERSGTQPTNDSLPAEPKPVPKPAPRPALKPDPKSVPGTGSNLESLLPIADANALLDLIASGHCPSDLNRLIDHSHAAGSRAA